MQEEKFPSMKRKLINLVDKLAPGVDVDSQEIEKWDLFFDVIQKELLKTKKPLFDKVMVSYFIYSV